MGRSIQKAFCITHRAAFERSETRAREGETVQQEDLTVLNRAERDERRERAAAKAAARVALRKAARDEDLRNAATNDDKISAEPVAEAPVETAAPPERPVLPERVLKKIYAPVAVKLAKVELRDDPTRITTAKLAIPGYGSKIRGLTDKQAVEIEQNFNKDGERRMTLNAMDDGVIMRGEAGLMEPAQLMILEALNIPKPGQDADDQAPSEAAPADLSQKQVTQVLLTTAFSKAVTLVTDFPALEDEDEKVNVTQYIADFCKGGKKTVPQLDDKTVGRIEDASGARIFLLPGGVGFRGKPMSIRNAQVALYAALKVDLNQKPLPGSNPAPA